jgi:hypothetical protein
MKPQVGLFLLSALALAQDPRGTIVGRVSDASGGVIPGVEVRATNKATGVVATAKTNEAGNYILPYLLPGAYTVTAENTGFRKFVRENVQVRINDTVELNIDMVVGSVSEVVEVKAETPILSTAEASLGQVVDERRVTELPLFAGNAMDLVHLAPGTVNGTDMRLRKAPFNNAPSQFSTDGSGNYGNEFTIDGVSNTYSDGTSPRVAFSPPATAIGEFKIQTSVFDAGLGHTLGASVNVSTKGGTNELHGEAHHWLRHSKLDAPSIFQNRSGQKLPLYQDNRYGFSAGAPVILPKLYNGRNKTFWFFTWEANKFGDPNVGASTSTVPSEAMRRGDLSALRALGAAYQVYDPFSTRLEGGRYVRTAFPNNIIPTARLDKLGVNILNLYPQPNQTGLPDGRNNFFRSGKALEDYWVWLARFDHAFSDKHRTFVRLHRDWWAEDKNRNFGNDVTGIILNRINRAIAFDDVYVFSPSFLLNFRYGLTQQEFPERRVSQGFDLAGLGFSPQLVSLLPDPKRAPIPRTAIGSLTTISGWESGDGVTASLTHSFSANFTRPVRNHSLRFGPEYRSYREFRNRYPQAISPDFAFAATYTRATDTSANPTVGGELTALLLGVPAGQMFRSGSYAEQDQYFALYLQDDWKVNRKLTLNIGLRYELETPITERFNRSVVGFDATVASPIEAQVVANYARTPIPEIPAAQFKVKGGLTFAGANGQRGYWKGQKLNFLPRFGFAYQLLPRTVLRGGYGIFFASIGVNRTNSILDGFSRETPIQATADNGLTYIATTANPFPRGLLAPLGAGGGYATNIGQNVTFFRAERKQPYAQRWSFGLQQELAERFVVEASYVGNRTTRLSVDRNLNALPAQYLSRLPTRDQATIDYLAARFSSPFLGTNPIYVGTTVTRSALLAPFPQFGNVTLSGDPAGYSWYHSLQVRVEKRFSKGYTIQAGYTWSKAMEAVEFLNASDPMPYESISSLDRTHRLVWTAQWELPFGRGKRFGANWHPAVNAILGGWQLNNVVQMQSGAPLGFGNAIFLSGNIKLPSDKRNADRWFNVDAFDRVTGRQLANNIRTAPLRFSGVRADRQSRWDFSLLKRFKVNERLTTEFRAETYNAMNHPVLRGPNTTPTNSAFGTITAQEPPRSWQMALKIVF